MDRVSFRGRIGKLIVIPARVITAFLEQATAQGSKSTVLRPVAWLLSISIAGTLGAVYVHAPLWVVVLFAVFAALAASLYLITYVYCLFGKKEDLLRSETYVIQKLAIEKGFYGDSNAGTFKIEESTTTAPTISIDPIREFGGMKKRFIVLLNGGTAEQHTAFKAYLNSVQPHAGWWHRFTDTWLVTDSFGTLSGSTLRDAAMAAFPGVHLLVIELGSNGTDTWSGFGYGGGSQLDMFSWLQTTWKNNK